MTITLRPAIRSSLPIAMLALACGSTAALAQALPGPPSDDTASPPPVSTIPVQPVETETPPPAAEAVSAAEPAQLGEVVVTAQKTKQSSRKVPISLTALSGDFIRSTGAASLNEVALYVPNARVEAHSPGSPQVYLRGFGTNAFNPAFEGSVAFVQDDLFFGRPGYFTESMYDIDRVEVLRGPQGTLFGKNTIAGVFNVTTRSPQGEPGANLDIFTGTHSERRLEGGAGGMFSDTLGARVSFLYRDVGGEIDNQFLNRKEDAVNQRAMRGKLRWLPLEGLTTELSLSTSRTLLPFSAYQLSKLDTDTRNYLRNFDPNIEDDPTNFRTSFDTPGFMNKGSDTGSLKSEYDFGERLGFTSLTGTLVLGASSFFIDQFNELDYSPADIARLDNHERHAQQSAELRFAGKASQLFGWDRGVEVVTGFFHYQARYDLLAKVLAGQDLGSYATTNDAALLASGGRIGSPLAGAGSLPGLARLRAITAPLLTDGDNYQFQYGQSTRADALFGQLTWKITDRWALTPGLRLGIETKYVDVSGRGNCNSKNITSTVTGTVGAPSQPCLIEQLLSASDYQATDQRRQEHDLSPKLALQYFADHGVNYYASFAKAAKSGGFNALALNASHLQFQGERATTYEVGAKGRFFDRTLTVNLGLYQTDFRNLQVLAFNGVAFDVGNAAALSRGLEGDFQWITPFRPLRVLGSLGVLDAHYTDYRNGPAPISQGIGATQDLSGKRVAFAPRGTGTLTPILTLPLLDKITLALAGDVIYQGSQFTDTDLDPNVRTPSYVKYNARLTLAEVRERWSLSIGGSNLGNKRVLNQIIDTIFFPGTYQSQQAPGRQLFAQLGLQM